MGFFRTLHLRRRRRRHWIEVLGVVDAAALSLARPDADASVPCWRNWSPEANLSLSLFVLFSGIISVKDEDVVACGNFHLVVIRSFARSLSGESLRFSTAPPPLFRLCSLRPTKIAPHYHQDHFCRNGGERTGQTQRGAIEANDRRSSCCGRRAGVIFAIAGNGLFS